MTNVTRDAWKTDVNLLNWHYEKEQEEHNLKEREADNYLVHVWDLPAMSKGFSLGNIRVMKEFFQTSDSLSWGTRAAFVYNILPIKHFSCWKEDKR